MLLKGGDEISSLLSALSAAEEKQAGIERSLDYLESSQSELGYLVEQYESQLETLLPSTTGGLSLTSADVERERSYALAETVNGQLDDISKNLGAMIDELNANNTGGKDADGWAQERDGSVHQIVAILNAHLGSLKWIDQSAGQLRGRLEGLRRGNV